jgi:hypothetical protein
MILLKKSPPPFLNLVINLTINNIFSKCIVMNYDIGLSAIPSLQKDITYGLSRQPLVVETLTKYFDEPITETKHKFCRYDAYSTTTKYEIKSRRCRYKTFATTIVPVHKVQDVTERLVFVFHFTDGLYYIYCL